MLRKLGNVSIALLQLYKKKLSSEGWGGPIKFSDAYVNVRTIKS